MLCCRPEVGGGGFGDVIDEAKKPNDLLKRKVLERRLQLQQYDRFAGNWGCCM